VRDDGKFNCIATTSSDDAVEEQFGGGDFGF
jgi:hypothetical protein